MTRTGSRRRAHKRPNWAIRILLIALIAFVAFHAVRLCTEIADTGHRIEEYDDAIAIKEANIESKKEQIKDGNVDGILEDKANEDGMVKPGQQIYQNSAG